MDAPSLSEVRIVIKTSLSDVEVQTFVDDAVLIAGTCPTLVESNAAIQKSAVKWLAAHLISTTNSGLLTQRTIGDAADSYAAPTLGAGLKATSYGQRALLLAPELANIGKSAPQLWVL
jgi:hypothetical protein